MAGVLSRVGVLLGLRLIWNGTGHKAGADFGVELCFTYSCRVSGVSVQLEAEETDQETWTRLLIYTLQTLVSAKFISAVRDVFDGTPLLLADHRNTKSETLTKIAGAGRKHVFRTYL